MEFITNLIANTDIIKLSYTFGGLLFIFSAAKIFYINFGLIDKNASSYKHIWFNIYLFSMGALYSVCGEKLPVGSRPTDREKLFALLVLGIIVGIVSYIKSYGIGRYRQGFYANIWAPIKLTVLFIINFFTFGLFSFILSEYRYTIDGMKKANHFYRLNSLLIRYCNMLSRIMVVIHTPFIEQTKEEGKRLVGLYISDFTIDKNDSIGRPSNLTEVNEALDKHLKELYTSSKNNMDSSN
jgi:hypothetical protein